MFDGLSDNISNMYTVYYTVNNGGVKVVKKELNKLPPDVNFEVDGIGFVSTPIVIMQIDKKLDRAYFYIFVFPKTDEDADKLFAFNEEDEFKFRQFLDNVRPDDFKG